MTIATNPHDALFKHIMSKPDNAREFLQCYLPPQKLALCDLSTLTLQKDSFIDEELKSCFCDLLWSVRTRNCGDGYIYWLAEHQSTDDPLIGFRMLRYSMAVIQRHASEHKKSKHYRLPLVIPLLFYTGKHPPDPAHLDWCHAFSMPQLAKETYGNPFQMVNVSDIPDAQIPGHKGLSAMELMFKTNASGKDLVQAGAKIGELLATAWQSGYTDDSDIKAIINYALLTDRSGKHGAFIRQIQQHFPQKQEQIMGIAVTFAEEHEQKGMLKGMEKGRQETNREIARNMLNEGLPFDMIMKLTKLTESELKTLRP